MQEEWKSFDEELAQEMKDIDFARGVFLFELREFGESIEKVLRSTIDKMDREWFANRVGEKVDVINSFVGGEHKLTDDEMNCYLGVLELRRTGTHSVEELRVANEFLKSISLFVESATPRQGYMPALNVPYYSGGYDTLPSLRASAQVVVQGTSIQYEENEEESRLPLVVNR